MFSGKPSVTPYTAGVLVVSLLAAALAVSTGAHSAAQSRSRYEPLQTMQHDFGSKSMTGYFVSEVYRCLVVLRVSDRNHADAPAVQTATRIRLALQPGETAGLDSEEGRSLNVTCGTNSASVIVETGERAALADLDGAARDRLLSQGPLRRTAQQ
jgi:NAD(P)H-nitrite reductase large subunit